LTASSPLVCYFLAALTMGPACLEAARVFPLVLVSAQAFRQVPVLAPEPDVEPEPEPDVEPEPEPDVEPEPEPDVEPEPEPDVEPEPEPVRAAPQALWFHREPGDSPACLLEASPVAFRPHCPVLRLVH
jgi:outer membrane biosynthesis protein TonB